jgi:hypothetical protein
MITEVTDYKIPRTHMLSQDAVRMLQILAKESKVSMSRLVDELIKEKYENR